MRSISGTSSSVCGRRGTLRAIVKFRVFDSVGEVDVDVVGVLGVVF